MAAHSSVTFPVTGIGQIPATGVSDVYVMLNAIGPTANGCLDDFSPDQGDTGICSATFDAGNNDTDSDIVQVSGSGDISLTNSSSGTVGVVVTVMGYYTDGSQASAGETYAPLPLDQIVETQSGLGAPKAQIPAGGTLTVQVTGLGGVPSDAAGAALYVGAKNSASTGDVSAYPAGGTASSLSLLSYVPGQAVHDLYFGALSSSGKLTLWNHGSGPVDLMVAIQGYLASPTGSEAGSTYQDVPQYRLADTRNGTGGVQSAPVQPGASITFSATGVDNIPQAGVSAVAETIVAVNPTAVGFLSEYAAGTADPAQPGVNFYAGGNQGNGLTASLVSSVSPTGQQTITNHSQGTVDIAVTVRGYYDAPNLPDPPNNVTATTSGSSATVSWTAPAVDGGAPISGYTVTATPDGTTTNVSGTATSATFNNLANPTADTFSVAAVNQFGTSDTETASPEQVITGTVTAPSGTPVPNDQISFVTNDGDATSAPVTPTVVGTATTDSNGNWSFTVPGYGSLPADAQASATANDGYLNIEAIGMGTATVNGTTYVESAMGVRSAWVGTAAQPAAPAEVGSSPPPTMVLRPDGPDNSAGYTQQLQDSSFATLNDPGATDASGDIVGAGADDPYASAPADAYGYQEVGGNGSYNPNVAADGTDLTNAAVTPMNPSSSSNCCSPNRYETSCVDVQKAVLQKTTSWTVVGEYHTGWHDAGALSYATGATSQIGSVIGMSGGDFEFSGYNNVSNNGQVTQSEGTAAGVDNDSRRVFILLRYRETRWEADSPSDGHTCYWWDQWDPRGIATPPGGANIKTGSNIWGQLSKSDQSNGKWWREDGFNGLENLLNYANHHWLQHEQCGWSGELDKGSGVTYGFAASVGGVGIQAETGHTKDVDQSVDTRSWTCSTRLDQKTEVHDSLHWVWGYNKAFVDHPKTFYMY